MIDLLWQAGLPRLPEHGIFLRIPVEKPAKARS